MRIHEIITELTFNGDPCTKDCSGHFSGALWSIRNNVTDPANCISNNHHKSFERGCADYAVRLSKGHRQIAPIIKGDKGRFQKFQPEKSDPRKYHQKKMSEPRPEQNKPDSPTSGY